MEYDVSGPISGSQHYIWSVILGMCVILKDFKM